MSDPRTELAAAGARLAALGLSPGSSGNLSVRIDDRVLITPTGADLAEVDPDGLSVLALDGTHLDGPRPSKEFPLHGAFYRRDDATRAVVHLHARNATAVSCLPPWSARSAVPPLTPYFVMRVGQTPSSRTPRPATRTRPRPWPCCLSRSVRHSSRTTAPSSCGPTMARAVDAAVELEEVSALLLSLGERSPRLLTPAEADALARTYDSPWGEH